jgi:putative tricarboxylic transport membrane protein
VTNPLDPVASAAADRLPPRVDLAVAAALLGFALTVFALVLRMPTFLDQKGEIYVAPGLVPGLYAIIVALLSVALAARSIRRARIGLAATIPPPSGGLQLAAVAALGLAYCAVLIGRLPFWLATALFVTAFIILFEWRRGAAPAARARMLAIATAIGLGAGIGVTLVFERLFLVRLP